jgi:hypothetical protein
MHISDHTSAEIVHFARQSNRLRSKNERKNAFDQSPEIRGGGDMNAGALAVISPKIGRLIRLLGSDSDGECLAAARALGRTLAGAGEDFHSLARAIENSSIETRPQNWRATAQWLINSGAYLSPKERGFVHQMAGWTREPSERQAQWLEALVERASRQRECA